MPQLTRYSLSRQLFILNCEYQLNNALLTLYSTSSRNGTSKEAEKNKQNKKSGTNKDKIEAGALEAPEEPTTCCMSGCANCVWLEYAEKLTEYFKDGGERSIKEINEKITDPNIKAYLLHELRMRNKK